MFVFEVQSHNWNESLKKKKQKKKTGLHNRSNKLRKLLNYLIIILKAECYMLPN